MLTKIKIKNYRSFREETTIDLTATNYQMLSETNTKNGIVKGLMFIGGNGTGKTNAVYAVTTLLDMLFRDTDIRRQFCLFSNEPTMYLEYTFKQDNDDIVYAIQISRDGTIEQEQLLLNRECVLDRIISSAKTGLTDKILYDYTDIDKKTLFLKTLFFYTKLVGNEKIQKWYTFLQNSVYFNAVDRRFVVYNDKAPSLNIRKYLQEGGENEINEFFKTFGFDQKLVFDREHKISDYSFAKIVDPNDEDYKEIFVKRNNMDIWIPYMFESLGNKTLLNMLPILLYSLKNEGLCIADEFSSAFHNELEELVIKFFMKNSKTSQLLFVSHSTNLLKTTLLRPDQIYTISFNDENGSKIKRVSSEHPRESQNLEKMYLSNIFSGMPKYKKYDNN